VAAFHLVDDSSVGKSTCDAVTTIRPPVDEYGSETVRSVVTLLNGAAARRSACTACCRRAINGERGIRPDHRRGFEELATIFARVYAAANTWSIARTGQFAISQ
jgi:hypothetical protein